MLRMPLNSRGTSDYLQVKALTPRVFELTELLVHRLGTFSS
jgi:hypothetical protein